MSLLGLEALRRPLRRVEFSECVSCPPAGYFSPKGTRFLQLFVHQIEDGRGGTARPHASNHTPSSFLFLLYKQLMSKKKNK